MNDGDWLHKWVEISNQASNLLILQILSNKIPRGTYGVPVTQLSMCNQNYGAWFRPL
jgi:hypothetical protein